MALNPRPLVLLAMLAWVLGLVSRFEAVSQAVACPRDSSFAEVVDARADRSGRRAASTPSLPNEGRPGTGRDESAD
jgi:hypothetical protein